MTSRTAGYRPELKENSVVLSVPFPGFDDDVFSDLVEATWFHSTHFSIVQSQKHKLPVAAAYNVKRSKLRTQERKGAFRLDPRLSPSQQQQQQQQQQQLQQQRGKDFYQNSPYDRGHMVPHGAICWQEPKNKGEAEQATSDSFCYSNVCPQFSGTPEVRKRMGIAHSGFHWEWTKLDDFLLERTPACEGLMSVFVGPLLKAMEPHFGNLPPISQGNGSGSNSPSTPSTSASASSTPPTPSTPSTPSKSKAKTPAAVSPRTPNPKATAEGELEILAQLASLQLEDKGKGKGKESPRTPTKGGGKVAAEDAPHRYHGQLVIPSGYWKVVCYLENEKEESLRVLSFYMDHVPDIDQSNPDLPPHFHAVTLADLEKLNGLQFAPRLKKAQEDAHFESKSCRSLRELLQYLFPAEKHFPSNIL